LIQAFKTMDVHMASEANMRGTLVLVPVALAVLSATHALQRLTKLANRRTRRTETEWSRLVTVIANPDLQAVVAFYLIGFLLTLNLILRFPDFGAIIEQFNQF
jgi:uncharacterized membrane protein YdfJ with MMPL/SSD domain